MPAAISVESWRVNIVRSFCLTLGRRNFGSFISMPMPPFFAFFGAAEVDLVSSTMPIAVGKRFLARIAAIACAWLAASIEERTSLPEASVAMKLNFAMVESVSFGRGRALAAAPGFFYMLNIERLVIPCLAQRSSASTRYSCGESEVQRSRTFAVFDMAA